MSIDNIDFILVRLAVLDVLWRPTSWPLIIIICDWAIQIQITTRKAWYPTDWSQGIPSLGPLHFQNK